MAKKYNGFNDNKSPIHGVGGGKDLLSSNEEQETVNKLLKRRFKQINDWPFMGNRYKIGQIFVFDNDIDAGIVSAYPHLFEELPWWSDREESEMPKYVKTVMLGKQKVLKVLPKECNGRVFGHEDNTIELRFIYPKAHGYFPATEKEFIDYQNSKQ